MLSLSKIQFLLINVLIIFIFGLIYKKYGNENNFVFINKEKKMNLTDAIFFSANNYVTIGNYDVYPKTQFMKRIILVQILILMIMLVMLSSCDKLFK